MDEEDSPSRSGLRALSWSFGAQGVARAGSFTVGLVLARLLSPESFGTYAIALSIFTILLQVDDLGAFRGLVRWPGKFADIAPTARLLSSVTGLALYALVFVLSPYVSTFVDDPDASSVIRIVCLGILLDSCVRVVPAAFLERTLQQHKVLVIELSAILFGGGASIAFSALGMGVWALAWGTIVGGLAAAVATVHLANLPWTFGWNQTQARELLGVSVPYAGAGLFGALVLNIDYLVIGRTLDSEQLGYYLIAFNMASWPATLAGTATRAVSTPQFSQLIHNGGDSSRAYTRGLCALVLGAAPFVAVVVSVPGLILVTIYGEQWVFGSSALRFLVLLSVVRLVDGFTDDLIFAHGLSSRLLVKNVLWLLLLIVVLPFMARTDGIRGVAIGHTAIGIFFVLPLMALSLRRLHTWRAGLGPALIVISAACVGAVAAGAGLNTVLDTGEFVSLLAIVIGSTMAFALLLLPFRELIRSQLS